MDDLTGSSKTTFYVESFPNKIRRFAWLIVLIALIIGGIVIWSGIVSGARDALGHAKDIRVALKMVSVEYYGEKRSLYDPSAESEWQKFVHADNGFGLAMWAINGRA